jgi:type III secretion protein HrpB1
MGTTLAFRTPSGAVDVPVGKTKELGTVNVHPFERIRVVADERGGSAGPVVIRLTITEGDELVAQLDTLTLQPNAELTRVYEVPKLTVFADALGVVSGTSSVDVLIYGSAPRAAPANNRSHSGQ